MGSAEDYFRYARDAAFIDIVGHQGNDFQITDAFWKKLNELTAEFDEPGKFVCLPGYEWSGNTGMGGDRNVFYRREGRPIRRSSHILVQGETSTDAIYTADALFRALEGEDAIVIAHVGGRYADVKYAHDGRLERAVEVHSTWGTFEWLLHDAFEKGFRVGVVCHSDDHKGRPGATRPGASSFGAVGGLTCYFMRELTRDALFDALRQRHHYGTTSPRIFIDVRGTTDEPVTRFSDDPLLGPAQEEKVTQVMMGDIVRPGRVPMRLSAEIIGTAPLERVDVLHGTQVAATFRNYTAADLGRRVRVLWQGAEYRGRGRETLWNGTLKVSGNRIARFAPVNFLNPERKVTETEPGTLDVDLGHDRQSRRHRPLARRAARRLVERRNERGVGHGRSREPRRPNDRIRRRRARTTAQRLSLAGERLEPLAHAGPHRIVFRWRGLAGLAARHTSRRQSGLDQSDLPDRLIRACQSGVRGGGDRRSEPMQDVDQLSVRWRAPVAEGLNRVRLG